MSWRLEASDGDEALDQFARQRFDLSLIEIDLPGMDGLALLAELKAASPDAVIILMTDNASVESIQTGAASWRI